MTFKGAISRRNFLKTVSATAAAAPFVVGNSNAKADNRVYNIAMLSTAHIHTRGFMNNIKDRGDCRMVYVWDDVEDRGRRYAEEFNVEFEGDLDAIVADQNVDGFIICSENTRHLPLLEKSLPTGKPVFCEKPLVTSTEDLKIVQQLLTEYKTPLFCGYFQPFTGQMQGIKKLIDDGVFGKITRVRYRNAHHAAYGRWFDNPDLAWFVDPELAGGGAFMDMGTHAVHLVLMLFGRADKVWAKIRNESGEYPEVDDFGVAKVEFKNGILGSVEAAWTQTGGISGLEIVGSERSLWYDGSRYRYGGAGHSTEKVESASSVPDRVDRLLAILKDEISQEDIDNDLRATMDAVIVMEAAYNSSKRGDWQSIS